MMDGAGKQRNLKATRYGRNGANPASTRMSPAAVS